MPSDAIEYRSASGETVYSCGKCRRLYGRQDAAERCCRDRVCTVCGGALSAEEMRKNCRMSHDACEPARRQFLEQSRYEKAEKLDSWDGRVFGFDNQLYESVDDYVDSLSSQLATENWPDYAWVADPIQVVDISFDNIVLHLFHDAYASLDEADIKGESEFKQAIAEFNLANRDLIAYRPSRDRVVMTRRSPEDDDESVEHRSRS
jgi:hypothetical protein